MMDLNLDKTDSTRDELDKCEAEIANLVEEIENCTEKTAKKECGDSSVKQVNGSTVSNSVICRYPQSTTSDNQTEKAVEDNAASFQRLSRRESSLENLAEDDGDVHITVTTDVDKSEEPVVDSVQKDSAISESTVQLRQKQPPSRMRRTLSTLFGCCTTGHRRHSSPDKGSDSNSMSKINEQNNPWTDCIRIRKFLDSSDDCVYKRTIPVSQNGDSSDAMARQKLTESQQSENGGPNLESTFHNLQSNNVQFSKEMRSVLLGPLKSDDMGKKCLIIDLDETLVHSSFKMVEKADFKVGVEIEGTIHTVYVLKRPHVDVFLQKMARIFECVLFTASLAKYADPVTDFLDKWQVFRWRLFREACVFHRGNYVKDLDMLGRAASQVVILDNSPASYLFHPGHAVQITSWFDDPRDTALLELMPYLEALAAAPTNVPQFLASNPPPAKATVPVSVLMQHPVPPSGSQSRVVQQLQTNVDDAQTIIVSVPQMSEPQKSPQPVHSHGKTLLNSAATLIKMHRSLPGSRNRLHMLSNVTRSTTIVRSHSDHNIASGSVTIVPIDVRITKQLLPGVVQPQDMMPYLHSAAVASETSFITSNQLGKEKRHSSLLLIDKPRVPTRISKELEIKRHSSTSMPSLLDIFTSYNRPSLIHEVHRKPPRASTRPSQYLNPGTDTSGNTSNSGAANALLRSVSLCLLHSMEDIPSEGAPCPYPPQPQSTGLYSLYASSAKASLCLRD